MSVVKPLPMDGSRVVAPAPEELRLSWIVLTVLFTVYFFSSVDRALFGILAQPVKEELLLAD